MILRRIIDFLFSVALALAVVFVLFAFGAFSAEPNKAMTALRRTAVRIDGNGCLGSGSIVEGKSGRHYLLTNQHLCACAQYRGDLYATFEGGELVVGAVRKHDWNSDLCAAEVFGYDSALKLGKSLPALSEISTRGYPGGRLTESHGKVAGSVDWQTDFPISEIGTCPRKSQPYYGSNGILAACILKYHSTLSSLFSRPGSSGSAVVNDDGQLVGVISSFHPGSDFEAGLVPFEDVKKFLETL